MYLPVEGVIFGSWKEWLDVEIKKSFKTGKEKIFSNNPRAELLMMDSSSSKEEA